MEKNGARMVSAYATLGRYDIVAIFEAPDAKTAAKISALIAQKGNFRAETLAAVGMEEFIQSVKG
ncbi:MAG: GYD domain-containing protein [Euryarchaeota archaeon]|nr:GYD domain-containing protein [Euryarchaeota archaeon]